jgi:hypothetical protein
VTNEFRIQPMRTSAAARRFAGSLNYDIAPGDAMFGGNHDHSGSDGGNKVGTNKP